MPLSNLSNYRTSQGYSMNKVQSKSPFQYPFLNDNIDAPIVFQECLHIDTALMCDHQIVHNKHIPAQGILRC